MSVAGILCLLVFIAGKIGNTDASYLDVLNSNSRIIGGIEAPPKSALYQVSLINEKDDHFCSGAIINERYILTVAHCIAKVNYTEIFALAGTQDLKAAGDKYAFERLMVHHAFVPSTFMDDIGFLKTTLAIQFKENVQPIPIASKYVPMGSEVIVTGWGTTAKDRISTKLQLIKLKTIGWVDCYNALIEKRQIFTNQLCTQMDKGQGTCFGDSGGPLVYNGELAGLVSWGVPCARGYPDVFTQVFDHASWINSNALVL